MTDRDPSLDAIIEILKEPADLAPGLTERVMTEIEQLPPPGAAEATLPVRWWHRRWTVRVSPLGGLGLAAAVGLLLLAGLLAGRRGGPALVPVAEEPAGDRLTQFVLVAPEASAVTVVGDFNDWSMSATPLQRAEGDGVWFVTVPLTPGRYRYAFVVNGRIWRNDPEAPSADDEFGRPNSVVTVGGA